LVVPTLAGTAKTFITELQGGGTSQLTDDEKVAAKLKDDGSDSEDEDDSEDGGVSLHDAAAHVPPEALRLEYENR
jgi:hypothetical protein